MPPNTNKRFSFADAAAQQPERQRFSFAKKAPSPLRESLQHMGHRNFWDPVIPLKQTPADQRNIIKRDTDRGTSISAPTESRGLIETARNVLPKGLSEPIFGTGQEFGVGKSDTGLFGFNFESLSKSDQTKFDEFSGLLQTKAGTDSSRAGDLASRIVTGQDLDNLTNDESKAIRTQKGLNMLFSGLESLDFLGPIGGSISKGAKFAKGSILDTILKTTDPVIIKKTLEDTVPAFKRLDTTNLSRQLAETSDSTMSQRLIDDFVQSATPAPSKPKRFSFAKEATEVRTPASARDGIIKRLEEPVRVALPSKKQADILPGNTPEKTKYLESIKKNKVPTQTELNQGIELLRLEGKQVDDLLALAKPAPVNQKLVDFRDGKPNPESGMIANPLGAKQQPPKESLDVSSIDDSIQKEKLYDLELTRFAGAEPGKRSAFGVQDADGTYKGTRSTRSSFPEWVPEDVRTRELFDKYMDGRTGNLNDFDTIQYKEGSRLGRIDDAFRKKLGIDKPASPKQTTQQSTNAATAQATIKQQKATGATDVKATKQWEADPVKAQAESTKEIAKEYSGTDSSKGFVSDAVNKVDGIPPVKNVTAKARNFSKENEVPIDLPDNTLGQYLITQTQDMAQRLGFLQKTLTKRGVTISDEANAYVQREAYIGRAAARTEKMQKGLGMQAGNKSGIFARMGKDNISVDDLGEYMSAKAAKGRNARVATVTEGKVPDGGSGITNKQAEDILKKYEGNTKIESYSKEFRRDVIDETIRIQKEFGLLTDEQAAMITKFEPDYVPFKVVDEASRPLVGKGFSVSGSSVKRLKGSARTDRTNPVMQATADMQTVIMRSEKNRSLQSLATLIRENPDKRFWEIKGIRHTPQYDEVGELMFVKPVRSNQKNNTIEFYENGKAYEITFHDEALAKVFTEEGMVKPFKALMKVNSYLRAVNTVVNPEFMVSNAIRDLQTAVVTAGGEKGLVVAAKMVKDQPNAMAGIWQATRKGGNDGWAGVYNEMVEEGGRTGWFDLNDVADETKRVSQLINRYNSTKTSDALMRGLDSTGKLISDLNEVAEMSIRVSAYKQLTDGGMSKTMAANYAKNMTVNFNKRGNLGMMINSFYLFANAGIQGSARIVMALKYPKVRKIVYGITASAYGINELNNSINPEGYARVQDFEKERNLIVMLPLDGNKYNMPGVSGDPRNGYYLKVPLPYGFNIFKVAGDVAYDSVHKKKTTGESMVKMLRSVDTAFNPLSSGTPSQFISPSVTDPFISLRENKNWFGSPIMPEQPAFAPEVRDSDRYFSGARDLSVSTAQFLNRLTGGNKVTEGAIDISPETIDHVIDTLGGGLGNFLGTSLDGAINLGKGEIPTPEEMPFVRKLIDKPFETGEQSQTFEMLERSSTNRMSQIEINRFVDNAIGALELGQIDTDTFDRVTGQFVENAVRQEAGEVMSLIDEDKMDEAMEVLRNAPPGISKQLNKLLDKEIDQLIKDAEK